MPPPILPPYPTDKEIRKMSAYGPYDDSKKTPPDTPSGKGDPRLIYFNDGAAWQWSDIDNEWFIVDDGWRPEPTQNIKDESGNPVANVTRWRQIWKR